jgi:hypothetical protein
MQEAQIALAHLGSAAMALAPEAPMPRPSANEDEERSCTD